MNAAPALSGFALAADELRQQEFARLAATVTPRIEGLRSLTPDAFRDQIALMLERLGHAIITTAPDLVTTKGGRKYVTACANPLDAAPTKTPALARLHAAVVNANAAGGFYVTARSFTPDAEHYTATLPILTLVDSELLNRSMQRSLKGVTLPPTYKAMCCQCGEIVQHRLEKGEALPCGNGHLVPATIARASLVKPRQPTPAAATGDPKPKHAPKIIRVRNMSAKAQRRRAIKAHNHQMRGSLHESALSVRHLGRSMNGLRAGMSAPPLSAKSRRSPSLAQTAAVDPTATLAARVRGVRYPIPERIFDYVSTVRSATAGTCDEAKFGGALLDHVVG